MNKIILSEDVGGSLYVMEEEEDITVKASAVSVSRGIILIIVDVIESMIVDLPLPLWTLAIHRILIMNHQEPIRLLMIIDEIILPIILQICHQQDTMMIIDEVTIHEIFRHQHHRIAHLDWIQEDLLTIEMIQNMDDLILLDQEIQEMITEWIQGDHLQKEGHLYLRKTGKDDTSMKVISLVKSL